MARVLPREITMPTHGPATHELSWSETSEILPCPVCGGTSACLIAETGDLVRCVRRVSKWPLDEGGWLHRITPDGGAPDQTETT